MRRIGTVAVLMLGLVAALAVEASAAGRGKGGGKGGGAGTGGGAGNPGSGANPTVSPQAQQDFQAAQAESQKADAALVTLKQTLRKDFEASPDFQAATEALRTAQIEYETARRPVLAALVKQADYQAAVTARNKALAARDAVVADASATFEQRTAAVTAAMDAGNAVTALEERAVTADPTCLEARLKVAAATQKLADLIRQFEASLPTNAQWQPAKAAADAAKQKVEAARKALAGQ